MPSEPTDPENYSISDMMDRLKDRASGDPSNGQLVTRADGSQAIRVRSRKRRSHQPKRESKKRKRRLRAFQIIGASVLVLLLGVLAVGIILYMNGSVYRDKLMTRIAQASGSKVEIGKVRVTPIGADVNQLAMTWPQSSPLKQLTLEGISAELRISSFLGGSWTGEETTAHTGKLWIGTPDPTAPSNSLAESTFDFNRFRCQNLSIFIGNPDHPAASLLNSEVSFYPRDKSGRPVIRLTGGTVKFPQIIPELALERAFIGVVGRRLDIVDMRFASPGKNEGSFSLSGQIEPIGSDGMSTLDVAVDSMSLDYLAGAELGRFFNGKIDTAETAKSNFLSFHMSQSDTPHLVVSFTGDYGTPMILSKFPFLSELRQILQDSSYEALTLDARANGVLRLKDGEVTLDNLNMEASNRLFLRGGVTVTKEKTLTGTLKVGLPVSIVNLNARLDALFGQAEENVRWLDVNLSGTPAAPADDFSKRVVSNEPSRPLDARPSPASTTGPAGKKFEELTAPR